MLLTALQERIYSVYVATFGRRDLTTVYAHNIGRLKREQIYKWKGERPPEHPGTRYLCYATKEDGERDCRKWINESIRVGRTVNELCAGETQLRKNMLGSLQKYRASVSLGTKLKTLVDV